MIQFNTILQAEKILNVSRPTIYRRIKDGLIPTVRLGSRVLIPCEFFQQLSTKAMGKIPQPEK